MCCSRIALTVAEKGTVREGGTVGSRTAGAHLELSLDIHSRALAHTCELILRSLRERKDGVPRRRGRDDVLFRQQMLTCRGLTARFVLLDGTDARRDRISVVRLAGRCLLSEWRSFYSN
jgi:hypothetical protein